MNNLYIFVIEIVQTATYICLYVDVVLIGKKYKYIHFQCVIYNLNSASTSHQITQLYIY